jgi:hypothetical protein
LGAMNRLFQFDGSPPTSESAECNCPDDCLVDHENA